MRTMTFSAITGCIPFSVPLTNKLPQRKKEKLSVVLQSISPWDLLGLLLPRGIFYSYLKGRLGDAKIVYSNWWSHWGMLPCLPSGLREPGTRGAAWASISPTVEAAVCFPWPWQYHLAAHSRTSGKLLEEQCVWTSLWNIKASLESDSSLIPPLVWLYMCTWLWRISLDQF